jgi:2-polyprenyl-6-methoxyphenol hydroxylase-like FAD-dependent oxidoreductase
MGQNWDVIIIGGGIGGLSAARFLRKGGIKTLVLERSPGLNEVGAGLQLAPNAQAALRALDLWDELAPRGWILNEVQLRSTRSGELTRMDAKPEGLVAMHRAQLQKGLAHGFSEADLRFAMTIQSITQDRDGVQVMLANGETLACKILIGADGLRSQVRSLVFPPVTHRYSGTSSYRGIVSAPGFLKNPHMGAEIWGPACRLGYSQINSADIYWYLTFDAPAQESKTPEERKAHALELMKNFPEELPIIARTAPEQIIHTDIGDIKPTDHWVIGRVALLGDAAHATTPNLGQGAAQALEDAWALGLAFKKSGVEPSALAAYRDIRRKKALWIVQQSWSFQSLCHLKSPWQQSLRDFAVKHTPAAFQKSGLKRIYTPAVGLEGDAHA